jgi:hypothetical protein
MHLCVCTPERCSSWPQQRSYLSQSALAAQPDELCVVAKTISPISDATMVRRFATPF